MKMREAEFERQFAAATQIGAEELQTQPRAVAVDYSKRLRKVRVILSNGCSFQFPPELVQGLTTATPRQLAEVRVLSPGMAIDWPLLDVQCQISALLSGVFGTRRWMRHLEATGRANSPKSKLARTDVAAGAKR